MIKLRPARASDIDFLMDMLYETVYFPGGEKKPARDQLLSLPEIYKYLDGFGSVEADTGLVAEDSSEGLIGAAWYRLFNNENKGYGYIADYIPEMAVAVVQNRRGLGIGTRLLKALIEQARQNGHPALSLSVAPDNPACRLYLREGFKQVGEVQSSLTMKLEL